MIKLKTIAEKINGHVEGDGNLLISGISSIKDAKSGDITFLIHPGFRKYLPYCKASAIIIGEDIDTKNISVNNIIIVKNPFLAYVKVAELFYPEKKIKKGIDPHALVIKGSKISRNASISAYVFIDKDSVIKRDTVLFPFVYVGKNTYIDEGAIIYPHVAIYDGVIIGKNVIIHSGTVIGSDGFGYVWDGTQHKKIPQLGVVEIEDNVEIGANVTIDRASLGKTVIKKGTKIDNLVQIAHNVSIGENSIIVSQVGIAGSATIGKNVILAGQVGVKDHITIGDNVKAGGQTGITKDVPANSIITGTPHVSHREWLKLQYYLKKLPDLFHKIKRIEEKLSLEDFNEK